MPNFTPVHTPWALNVNSSFFKNIPEITQFVSVINKDNFIAAPDDWIIVIADIRNSTKAVDNGKYKDVNMIGGAVICAVKNATENHDWPFVFGGDGATLLIEPSARPRVEAALVRTRTMARDEFGLELLIGFVPVKDMLERNTEVLVARYEVSPGNSLAQFGGGGVELAEKIIKSKTETSRYVVSDYSLEGMPDLNGLSCRWEPLKTQKGKIVCILVKAQATDFQHIQSIFSDFLAKLAIALGTGLDQASPVTKQSMHFTWPPKGLIAEAKMTRGDRSFWSRLIELYVKSFIQFILERFDLDAAGYNAPIYREELRNSSDYCKFDEVLKMVLDCTEEQAQNIESLLQTMHADGVIDFGFFATEQALMTCLLFDLEASQHVHFVDGDNGGLYYASRDLKQHLASSDTNQ